VPFGQENDFAIDTHWWFSFLGDKTGLRKKHQ
jgi:hypothetical protein